MVKEPPKNAIFVILAKKKFKNLTQKTNFKNMI